jgi:hypothetical protein
MANYFTLTLDTQGPASPSVSINNGATYATSLDRLVDATIGTSDSVVTGYQMKIWGDLDLAWAQANGIIKGTSISASTADDAILIAYSSAKQLKLKANTDPAIAESKNINVRIYDDVLNPSSDVSTSIILDTQLPTVNITGPDVSKISEQSGKNVASFSFQVSEPFVEYKIKVVTSSGASHDTGTIIPITTDTGVIPTDEQSSISTTPGATSMTATGTFSANTPITVKINGTDLRTASSGDGQKIIKVFVKDQSNQWSAS